MDSEINPKEQEGLSHLSHAPPCGAKDKGRDSMPASANPGPEVLAPELLEILGTGPAAFTR
jgi:hypothetical protein